MPKLVGMNHIALEVDDIDEALTFWESIFGELELRGRGKQMAFIDMGDQFIALARGRTQPPDQAPPLRPRRRRQGSRARAAAGARHPGLRPRPGLPRSVGQPDPGRRLPRHPVHEDGRACCSAMGIDGLEKSESALAELRAKGISTLT